MERPAPTLGLVLAALVVGCGASSPRGTATLSDNLDKLTLTNVSGSVGSGTVQWGLAVDAETRELPTFHFSVAGSGTLLPIGVSTTSSTVGSFGLLQSSDSASEAENMDSWFVLTGSNQYGVQTGTFELNLSSIGDAEPVAGGLVWPNVHGTFTATLTAQPANGPGGAADVILDATF